MPILSLQRRARELGRIRIGQVTTSSNGRAAPTKLDRFRLTSPSEDLIAKVAALYGGAPGRWTPQGGGAQQWEVVTESTRLPVLVPPQPVTQWYELWSGGGCQRRCDGERELLTDQPCLCSPDPEERDCKPTTRLNVVLREIEGIGVWRLESHGYYAAVELPGAAELLAATNGYVQGFLGLEERVVKRNGNTRRFMVPVLDVGITPEQLVAGQGGIAIGSGEQPTIASPGPAALPAGDLREMAAPVDVASVEAAIAAVTTLDDLRALWPEAQAAGLAPLAKTRATELEKAQAVASGDPDVLWAQVLRSVPEDWTTDQVEREFATFAQVEVEQASAGDMQRYLDHLAK